MRWTSSSGLTLVELLVVVLVLGILSAALFPAGTDPWTPNSTAVGARGKDIWVAITGANTERKALGLPPLWPTDLDAVGGARDDEKWLFEAKNSTEYFRGLFDEQNRGSSEWCPYVAGFDYGKLAGAGVSACPRDQTLSAANNMWTVVKNVRDEMSDIIPVLITRNVDASSLSARVGEQDLKEKKLRFDPSWQTPFSDKSFVMIRKGGVIFKARPKYMTYKVVYRSAFDTALTTNGVAMPPLKYLTPTREITPGEQAYVEGASIAYQLAGGWYGKVKREARCAVELFVPALSGAILIAFVYLAYFARSLTKRKKAGMLPLTSAPIIGVWICHYLAVTFYAVGSVGAGGDKSWVYVVVALAAQAVGIGLALMFQRKDRETRMRQIKWLLVPLWVVLICMALMAMLVLACGLN